MKYKLLFLFLLLSIFCIGQENCNNGIDDDGDGKIDLNDSECVCNTSAITSIIPNPSFETHTDCPSSSAQLSMATPWIQATQATTDYFNTCGLMLPAITDVGLQNLPDGNGIAAAVFLRDWNEYLGATLLSPMIAGKNYQLSFNIAALKINNDGAWSGSSVNSVEPVNVTLYGCNNGTNLPLNTVGSPNLSDPTWIEIGHVTYTPVSFWGEITITFMPSIDINAIMLGPPAILPISYPTLSSSSEYPYFLFDNLLLNTAAAFGVNITQTGDFCGTNLVLSSHLTTTISSGATYQWYHNGIAILGATNISYPIPSLASSLGNYSVKVTDGNDCYISTKITVNNIIPAPDYTIIQPTCNLTTGTVTITTPASEYSFDNGQTWGPSAVSGDINSGDHLIKIKKQNGCISESLTAIVIPFTSFPIPPTATSPQTFCIQQNVTLNDIEITGQNIKWYDALTAATLLLNTTPLQNNNTYYPSQTINGCESERVPIVVNIQNTLAPTGNAKQSFCTSQNPTLSTIVVVGSTMKWYDSATLGNLLTDTTSLVDGKTYYASQTENNCESTNRLAITVSLISSLPANDYDFSICDDLNDGTENVKLEDYNTHLISNTSNYNFTYYESLLDAENEVTANKITTVSNYKLALGENKIYARINSNTPCYAIAALKITLLSKPIIPIQDIVPICENKSIWIDAGMGADNYLWSNGKTTQILTVENPGDLSVTVTKNHNTISCSSSKSFTIKTSNIAKITAIETKDWTDNDNTITVFVTGSGDFEYSIDGHNYQDSNIFSSVNSGEYTVHVRDKNGCGTATEEVYLLMYPKFFTPNGDGFNDTWKIKSSDIEVGLMIRIFDRFGKLLKELDSNSTGWDGTYIGQSLPSSDYWFVVTRKNGKEYKGHFSLKR